MRKLSVLVGATLLMVSSCSKKQNGNESGGLAFIEGGTFVNTRSNLYGKNASIADFYMGQYEVTQKEWVDVMKSNPSKFKGDHLPVENISWYDAIEFCNARSLKEGLAPYYLIDKTQKDTINKTEQDSIKWIVSIHRGANGYRLPTEAEWEYAAGGGQSSKSYRYSGSDTIDEVAWYWQNSGDKFLTGAWSMPAIENNNTKTKTVGSKKPNELGLYDMSGSVREWCEDWFEDESNPIGIARVWRGGGWIGSDFCCEPVFRAGHHANGAGPDQGFRLCRSI